MTSTTSCRDASPSDRGTGGDPQRRPEPRQAIWSTQDLVTLFGAVKNGSGCDQLSRTFRSPASRWSNCADQRVDIVAAGVSGTWPTRSASNPPRCRSTASRSSLHSARHPGLPSRARQWKVVHGTPTRSDRSAPSWRSIDAVSIPTMIRGTSQGCGAYQVGRRWRRERLATLVTRGQTAVSSRPGHSRCRPVSASPGTGLPALLRQWSG